ncbi:MAG: hypothetical protein UT28_C0001G1019 [Berkelbacteria bacterium GW2011_GWE1_39_12]|uniref:Uncharacterized protein n=1 Tax=Berkelbacteria bacterium GW2011_GWE1_39_12 TaxID=1618337 RepID=A0A0G4B5W5_9BACT|nr:MAG: hypothetical protein UT28_C0001G1019 [Berkelbacteria bacterium GW2011_GWE1_39_12]
MLLETVSNLIWTGGMNLPDVALIVEDCCDPMVLDTYKKEECGNENSSHFNLAHL